MTITAIDPRDPTNYAGQDDGITIPPSPTDTLRAQLAIADWSWLADPVHERADRRVAFRVMALAALAAALVWSIFG